MKPFLRFPVPVSPARRSRGARGRHALLPLLLLFTAAAPSSPAGPPDRVRAPDFTLRTVDGDLFTLSSHLGKGPVILHFWATWCLPCMAEMKAMKKALEQRKQDNITVLSVSVDDNKTSGKVKSHVRARRYPFTILMDGEKRVFDAFRASGMPHLFLLDGKGDIVYSHMGFNTGDELLLMAQLDALGK